MMKSWRDVIGEEKQQPYFQKIIQQVNTARQSGQVIYPPKQDIFNAFRYTEFNQVKAVIIGQDPYHNENQAHGLAFSVQMGVEIPPSLKNIYKELASDIDGFQIPTHGCLKKWADEGVLLLNTVLTVKAHLAHSHKDIGWETFTDKVIEVLNNHRENLVFLLWGNPAQKKGSKIDTSRHLVLKAAHPSPLSAHRGFFGCRHFSQTNQYLRQHGISPIDWQV